MCCPQAFFPLNSCEIVTKSCKKQPLNTVFSCDWKTHGTSLYWIYCCLPLRDVVQVPKGVTCQAFSCALVQCHLTPDTALVTFHLWKCELWPLEEWPLILTGPNGAWRTGSDRRQMETQHASKDGRTCAGGQRDTLMEWTGLQCWPEEWRENQGDRPRQGSAYTGNCWDMQVMSVSMFIDPADTEEEASTCIAPCKCDSFLAIDWIEFLHFLL